MMMYEAVRAARIKAGMTQEEVAEKLYITQQMIQKIESGEKKPPLDRLVQLADLYKVSMDELVGRQINKREEKSSAKS